MELVFKPISQDHQLALSNIVKLNQNLTENQQEFEDIFETFLGFEVADGRASPDTVELIVSSKARSRMVSQQPSKSPPFIMEIT